MAKQSITIRLDREIIDFFKTITDGHGYQTKINAVLKEYMAALLVECASDD